jgi:hypothetical protein
VPIKGFLLVNGSAAGRGGRFDCRLRRCCRCFCSDSSGNGNFFRLRCLTGAAVKAENFVVIQGCAAIVTIHRESSNLTRFIDISILPSFWENKKDEMKKFSLFSGRCRRILCLDRKDAHRVS